MSGESDPSSDVSRFVQFDDIHLYSIDSDLKILWSSTAEPTAADDQLVGMIRRIIARTWQEVLFEEAERPTVFSNFIQISDDGDRQLTYLLTIQPVDDDSDEDAAPIYNAVAQKVSGSIENGTNGIPADDDRWTRSKAFRKFLHKLSNPLSIISGFSQYMLEKNPENSPDREFLEEIFTNARRIRDLIDEAALPAKSGPLPTDDARETESTS